jgi:hypothetical protein
MSYQGPGVPDGQGGHGASSGGYDPYAGGNSNPPGGYGASSGGYDPYTSGNPNPAGGYGGPQTPSPYGAGGPQTPSPYGAPGGYGAPETPSPYAVPAAGGYGVPAGGYAAAGAYGAPGAYGGYPPPKRSNTGLIVGLVIGGVVLLFVIAGVLFSVLGGGGGSYGSDPALDRLYDQCEAGDNQACDDLYNESPADSEYREFGDTCGGRTSGGTWCVNEDF